MAFRIQQDEKVELAIRRIAAEQIDRAIAEIDAGTCGPCETVHQVRKRCKKIRGLIRLVRPQLADAYSRENTWFRDTARQLADVRDSQAVVETLDALLEHYADHLDREAFAPAHQELVSRCERIVRDGESLEQRFGDVRDRLSEARHRVVAWRISDSGFDALEGGLKKTYRRGRGSLATAYDEPSVEKFHNLRKRAKYHWYHTRLLQAIWPTPLKARRDEVHRLSNLLGDDHDLAVLRETLLQEPASFGGVESIQALIGLLDQRQVELRIAARGLGKRVFAESSRRFAKRLRRYWRTWTSENRAGRFHEPCLAPN